MGLCLEERHVAENFCGIQGLGATELRALPAALTVGLPVERCGDVGLTAPGPPGLAPVPWVRVATIGHEFEVAPDGDRMAVEQEGGDLG